MEYRLKNYNIFSNVLLFLVKNDLVRKFDESTIDNIKKIIINEIKNKDERKKNNSLFVSCLKFLIGYYFIDNQNSRFNENNLKNKENNFHLFLRAININWDFFYSLIETMKEISNNSNENNESNNNKINNENNIMNIEDNEINQSNSSIMEENYLSNFSQLPLLDIDFKKLNEFQTHIIKSLFEDIIFILYRIVLKRENRINSETKISISFNSIDNNELFIEKDIFDTLKKNIDYIFKFKKSLIFQEIFSSETEICAELFYLKWRFGLKEGGDGYAENAIKKYNKYLLKNHPNPFIFKFYLLIFNKNLFPLGNIEAETIKQKTNKIKLTLLNYIVDILNDTVKEAKAKKEKEKENSLFYRNNLLNLLFILNEELSNEDSPLFSSNSFYTMIFKYISLLDKTCLLYSNYYLEIDDNCGKIVSEVIYDIFFAISVNSFNEKEFMKAFTKENRKEKEIFTIFYLIDIFKEEILGKEKRINEELKKYIPDIDNLKIIQKNDFSQKKNKSNIKLFLDKNLYQIEDVNFSIYFLAKSYIYLKKKKLNDKFKSFLKEKFLPLLSKNIFRLYTKRSNFYGNKMCQKFPLYSLTKIFIETFIIPNPNKFESYNDFFFNDMPIKIKEEYSIFYCCSSRLLDDTKIPVIYKKKEISNIIDSESANRTENENNIEKNNSFSSSEFITNTINSVSTKFLQNIDLENSLIFNSSYEELESNKSLDSSNSVDKQEKDYINNFELIKKESIIFNPKNYFFKNIFGEIYKNIIFNDNAFKLIKLTYFSKLRKYNINKNSKQIKFPAKQKNFSNSIEPKIFLRKNFGFYDLKMLSISHGYLNLDVVDKYKENVIFYRHNYKINNQKNIFEIIIEDQNEKSKFINSELVTNQYIYFGKMYFFENYIFFESEKDPRINTEDFEIFLKYAISHWTKNEIPPKRKDILIYIEDIKEILKRRTLYLYQSIEIFLKNGKSYFFNFFNTKTAKSVYNYFSEINQNSKNKSTKFTYNANNNEEDIKNLLLLFHKGKISNYDYILKLNKFATRTYNDVCQYPVFPWLILEYSKLQKILDLLEKKETPPDIQLYLRDMKYPILSQNEEKRKAAKLNFCDGEENFPEFIKKERKEKKKRKISFTFPNSLF